MSPRTGTPAPMTTTTQPQPDRPAPYGGYRLTKVRRAGGQETVRFEAVLTHHGVPLAHVTNGGEGGSHRYDPTAPTGGWEAIRTFEQYAAVWNARSDLAGYEDHDQLVNRLLEVDRLRRMRSTPFVLDSADPWADGAQWCTLRGASREETLALLRTEPYANRRTRVWDRDLVDFVPLG